MKQYTDLIRKILAEGRDHSDRTGHGRRSIFGHQMRFDLSKGFPLVTNKFTAIRPIIHELLWFLSGDTNIKYLLDNNVHIWDQWALSKDALKMTPEERVVFLKKTNKEVYSQYLLDISWQTGGYDSDDIFNGLSVDDFNQTRDYLLDEAKAPIYSTTHFKEGDLGQIYPALWRRAPGDLNKVILIDRRTGPSPGPVDISEVCQFEGLQPELSSSDIQIEWENDGAPYKVIRKVSESGAKNSRYLIQFNQTGTIREVNYQQMKRVVLDPYQPSMYGVACLGRPSGYFSDRAYTLWRNMIVRCYDKSFSHYRFYGEKGIYVSPRWLCFENFLADLSKLPNYEQWALNSERYDLDKDYYGSNCYDVSTCAFIKKDLNALLSNEPRHTVAISPAGEARVFFSRKDLVESLDVSDETLRNYMNGRFKKSSLDGWKFEDYVPPEDKLLRPQLVFDQIATVIENIRNNPFSSRHVVSCWFPNILPVEGEDHSKNVLAGKQALPPCHTLFQFFVEELTPEERQVEAYRRGYDLDDSSTHDVVVPEYRLSCQLYQR